MDTSLSAIILLTSAVLVLGQRPFFAGTKPIGFPDIPSKNDGLGNRFGESNGTTPTLPIEANGDLDLLNRLSKLPVDKQPFWFINWQAYDAQRKNPQTYPQRPNSFIDPIPNSNNVNSGVTSTSQPLSSSSMSTTISDSTANRFGEPDSNSKVKPVRQSSPGDKIEEIKAEPEVKPVPTKAPSSDNEKDKPKVESTTPNATSTNSNSEDGTKLEEVGPIVPSPIEPEQTLVDGLKLSKDSSDSKKFRYLKHF